MRNPSVMSSRQKGHADVGTFRHLVKVFTNHLHKNVFIKRIKNKFTSMNHPLIIIYTKDNSHVCQSHTSW